MKMKRIAALCMTAVLTAGASMTVWASEETHDVIASYTQGKEETEVYSVEITWGSMAFKYTDSSKGTWNPENHTYENGTSAAWSCEEGADTIIITNHSNKGVEAAFAYTPEAVYTDIEGNFDQPSVSIGSAVGTLPDNAPSGQGKLSLSGTLDSATSDNQKVGTVTVTIQ